MLAVLGAGAFVLAERRAADPMLPLGLLRSPAFVGANAVAAAMNFVGIGTIFLATLYLQEVQHRSTLLAGVLLVPLFAPLAVLSPVTGRLTARFGPRPPMALGLLLGAAGAASLLLLTPESPYASLLPALVGLGLGMGFLTAAVVAAAMRSVRPERAGLASAVNNTARQAGGAQEPTPVVGVLLQSRPVGSPTAGLRTSVSAANGLVALFANRLRLLAEPTKGSPKSTMAPVLTFCYFCPRLWQGRKELSMAELIQVRQAARALGVHENTIRRWEERGLLRAVRLPSGVRRFRAEDIEAVRDGMFSGFAPLREDDDIVPVTRVRSVD